MLSDFLNPGKVELYSIPMENYGILTSVNAPHGPGFVQQVLGHQRAATFWIWPHSRNSRELPELDELIGDMSSAAYMENQVYQSIHLV